MLIRASTAGIELSGFVSYKIISSVYNVILFSIFPINSGNLFTDLIIDLFYRALFTVCLSFWVTVHSLDSHDTSIPTFISPKTENKYDHSTLSNAFSVSSDITNVGRLYSQLHLIASECYLRRIVPLQSQTDQD